jgi:type III secretion system FlhB-like substrate exporter
MPRDLRKNKPDYRRAVALRYRGEHDLAPQVTAAGQRIEADLLVRLASRYGVPVVNDPALAQALESVPVDQQIPKELYKAVATVLSRLERGRSSS